MLGSAARTIIKHKVTKFHKNFSETNTKYSLI